MHPLDSQPAARVAADPTPARAHKPRSADPRTNRYPPEAKGAALAMLAARMSPEQVAPMMSIPACTIRRWRHDPRVTDDSVVAHYVREKIKELAVTTAELAEDAAVATSELILSRDGNGAAKMNLAYCTLLDRRYCSPPTWKAPKSSHNTHQKRINRCWMRSRRLLIPVQT